MSDCQTCEREGVCDYAHKPCDCVHYRKFVAAPKRPCDDCIGSGWNAYPIRCRACNGCGFVRDDTPHVGAGDTAVQGDMLLPANARGNATAYGEVFDLDDHAEEDDDDDLP